MANPKITGRIVKVVLSNGMEIRTDNRCAGVPNTGFMINPSDPDYENVILVVPHTSVAYIETAYPTAEEVNAIFETPAE